MIQLWNFNAGRFTFWCCPGKSSEPPITIQGKFTCIVTPEHYIKDRRIQLWNIPISHYVTLSSEIENLTEDFKEKSETDMEFVQKFTQLDFQAKNFTPPISPNFNSFSKEKHKKLVKMEKFTPLATNFTLPPGLTGWTNFTSEWWFGCVTTFYI